MLNGTFGRTSILLFSGRCRRWTRPMFGSHREKPFAVELSITGVLLLDISRTWFASSRSTSRAVTWMASKLLVSTVLLIVFERYDTMMIVCELLSTTFNSFERIRNICRLTTSVAIRIETARVSATRNLDLICSSPIVT